VRRNARQRIAAATWKAPKEGSLYGHLELDAGEALRYLKATSAASGVRVTITHLVGKAVGLALAESPDLNARVVLGRIRRLRTIDIGFVVSTRGHGDLSSVRIRNVDTTPLVDIATVLENRAAPVRDGKDADFGRSSNIASRVPYPLTRPVLWACGAVQSGLGLAIPPLGLKADGFGGAMVSSVAAFGIEQGFGALVPFSRAGTMVLVGVVKDRAVVRDGAVVSRPMIDLGITLDHRLVDGAQIGAAADMLRKVVEHPMATLGPWEAS